MKTSTATKKYDKRSHHKPHKNIKKEQGREQGQQRQL